MTSVQICNAALSRLGANLITSLEDGTKEANTCKANWESVRNSVLRGASWPGTTKRASLARLSDTPLFGYSYQYQLPSDYLKLVTVDDDTIPHKVEGKTLLSDAETVNIEYVYKAEDGFLDAGLVEALITAMMEVLAFPLTASAAMSERAAAKAAQSLQQAKGDTTFEQDQVEDELNYSWLNARL